MKSLGPERNSANTKSAKTLLPLVVTIVAFLVAFLYVGLKTWYVWEQRQQPNFHRPRDFNWKMLSGNAGRQSHIRIEGTAYWLPAKTQVLSSNAHILTDGASTTLRDLQTESTIAISASAVAHLAYDKKTTFTLLSGVANITGPVAVMLSDGVRQIEAGQSRTVSIVSSAASTETIFVDKMTPNVGTNIELIKTPVIDFRWSVAGSESTAIEFARDPNFQSVLFARTIGDRTSTKFDFGDRGHGAWFVRVRDRNTTLAVTSFHSFEKLTPDRLRRSGRRWITWDDRGPSNLYRVEFSSDSEFSNISQSELTRAKFFDLSLALEAGVKFIRVIGIDQNESEYASESLPIEIPPRELLLQARTEFGDPRLAMFARGWRIQLNELEAKRIREGYVILRENELRGIKVSTELDEKIKAHPGKYLFEVAKDLEFSNPERVRPTSRGELLPPALPLGTIYTRIRELEEDGLTLGTYGPASRISTLLPAPRGQVTLFSDSEAILKWTFPFVASGFKVEIRSADSEVPKSYRTQGRMKQIQLPKSTSFQWTVTAIDEAGRSISVASAIAKASRPVAVRTAMVRDNLGRDQQKEREDAIRELASIDPSLVQLESPIEDAVIVGGATATKYGRLLWRDLQPTNNTKADAYVVEIATDADFVNIIERASTSRSQYTLQGDLPEGALFWRVKKRKTKVWSTYRKFEIIYE